MGIKTRVCQGLFAALMMGAMPVFARESPVLQKPAGTVLVEQFVEDMQQGRMRVEHYLFPFWLDHYWIQDAETLQLLFAEGAKQRPFPVIEKLRVEIHPLTLLEHKSPRAWEQLSTKASGDFLEKTRLALVFFDIQTPETQKKNEENWLLVQQDAQGTWRLTGLLER